MSTLQKFIDKISWYWKTPPTIKEKIAQFPLMPIIYDKLYEADGKQQIILSAEEADELLDYLQYITWLNNPPK